ncbi:MAG: precorrin-6A/cobalt-precorrin-6A reductase [Pseudomonadales bacterium]|nr:precorrin-6A/cobalt-precorrin-6A reductase [Pseudomonadales bacterium]
MCLLILGGTREAKKIALQLHQQGVPLIYSVAGLVRQPDLPCQIVSGGFAQFGGLIEFIKANAVAAILDVTHPFAQQMSATASQAVKQCDIAYWSYQRPQWPEKSADNWTSFDDWPTLLAALKDKKSVFISTGQLKQEVVDVFAAHELQTQFLRTAIQPTLTLPDSMLWIQAIGPFSVVDEKALFKKHGIDVLVSKMSGGVSTQAKIDAARELGIPVFMLARPHREKADKEFSELHECKAFVLSQFSEAIKDSGF